MARPLPLSVPSPARAGPPEGGSDPRRLNDDAVLRIALGAARWGTGDARGVLERLGGARGMAGATRQELVAAGVPDRLAAALWAGAELARRGATAWPEGRWVVRIPADVGDRLLPVMAALEREELRVLLLDTKNAVVAERTVYVGNLAGTAVRVSEVFRDAVRACAAAIVVVHNHPSGDPTPSAEDVRITAELAEAGRLLDIELLDHLVLGRTAWASLRAHGAMGPPAAMGPPPPVGQPATMR